MRRVKRELNVLRSKSLSSHVASPRLFAASRHVSQSLWRSMKMSLNSVASPFVTKVAQSQLVRCLSISLQKILEERLKLPLPARPRKLRERQSNLLPLSRKS